MFCWEMVFRIAYLSFQGQRGICLLKQDSLKSINTFYRRLDILTAKILEDSQRTQSCMCLKS